MRLSAGVPDGTGEGRLIRRSPPRSRVDVEEGEEEEEGPGLVLERNWAIERQLSGNHQRNSMETPQHGSVLRGYSQCKARSMGEGRKHGQGEEGGLHPPGSRSQTRRSRQKPCVHPAPRGESIVYFGLVDPRPLPPSEIARRVTDTTQKSVRAFHVDSNGLPSLKRGGAARQPHGENTPSRRPPARVSPVT